MKKSYFFPVALILIGTIMLLNQFDLMEFRRPYIFIYGFAFLGVVFIRKAFLNPDRRGLLGGSFFIFLSAAMLLIDLGYLPIYDYFVFPVLLVSLGLSNLIYYAFTRKSFSNVTFGLIFIAAGIPFLIMHYGDISYYEVADLFHTYWPVLLITAGFGFLIEGMIKKTK